MKKHGINRLIPWGMLAVSLTGFCMFYLFPFLAASVYSVWDSPISRSFCGLQNYAKLFQNEYFVRGAGNTALFLGIAVPLNLALSLALALAIRSLKRGQRLCALVFLIPLALPSAAVSVFWKQLFGERLADFGVAAVVILFIWKNVGYDMALFLSGLRTIPQDYYECADMEGAGRLWKHRHITLVYLTPLSFSALVMTVVNSFGVFRELYLIAGDYPPDGIYLLQHEIYHLFLALDYPRLVCAVYLLTAGIVLFVAAAFWTERRLTKDW